MSRMALAMMFALAPAAAMAQAPETEGITLSDGRVLKPLSLPGCPKSGDAETGLGPEEIVVCGNRPSDEDLRLPLRVAREPGARTQDNRATGMAALEAGTDTCTPVGQNQRCSGGLPVLPMIVKGIQVLKALIDPDE